MQFFILFIGAMVFVFYLFEQPPVLFQQTELQAHRRRRRTTRHRAAEYQRAFERPPRRGPGAGGSAPAPATARGKRASMADYRAAQKALDAARADAARLVERTAARRTSATPTTSSSRSSRAICRRALWGW